MASPPPGCCGRHVSPRGPETRISADQQGTSAKAKASIDHDAADSGDHYKRCQGRMGRIPGVGTAGRQGALRRAHMRTDAFLKEDTPAGNPIRGFQHLNNTMRAQRNPSRTDESTPCAERQALRNATTPRKQVSQNRSSNTTKSAVPHIFGMLLSFGRGLQARKADASRKR